MTSILEQLNYVQYRVHVLFSPMCVRYVGIVREWLAGIC